MVEQVTRLHLVCKDCLMRPVCQWVDRHFGSGVGNASIKQNSTHCISLRSIERKLFGGE